MTFSNYAKSSPLCRERLSTLGMMGLGLLFPPLPCLSLQLFSARLVTLLGGASLFVEMVMSGIGGGYTHQQRDQKTENQQLSHG